MCLAVCLAASAPTTSSHSHRPEHCCPVSCKQQTVSPSPSSSNRPGEPPVGPFWPHLSTCPSKSTSFSSFSSLVSSQSVDILDTTLLNSFSAYSFLSHLYQKYNGLEALHTEQLLWEGKYDMQRTVRVVSGEDNASPELVVFNSSMWWQY